MKTFSVIIAHLNNENELYYTIWDLLKELDGFDYEIIIVDNRSYKERFEWVKNIVDKMAVYHDIRLFQYDKYQGTVPPWQFGIMQATGEYLILIDSHVVVCRDYFKKQYEILKKDKEIKVLYSASVFTNYGKDMSYCYVFDKNNLELLFLRLPLVNVENLFEPLVSQMGCVIIDREFFVKIEMFGIDCFNKYGGYGAEELMLALKTKMFGGKTVFNKEIFFHHSILHKFHGRQLKLQNKAIAAYVLNGYEYMFQILKNQKEYNEEYDGSKTAFDNLLKEIPLLASKDRELIKTAPISYIEILKKYEKYT